MINSGLVKMSEDTWWKLNTRTLIALICFTAATVALYGNLKSDIARLQADAQVDRASRVKVEDKMERVEEKLNIMNGKLDVLIRRE